MKQTILTYCKPSKLTITVTATKNAANTMPINLIVSDSVKGKNVYCNMKTVVNGSRVLEVYMPFTPTSIDINISTDYDFAFDAKINLTYISDGVNSLSKMQRNFMKFLYNVLIDMHYTEIGNNPTTFISDCEYFRIDLYNVLEDNKTTPARIDRTNGIIDISYDRCKHHTIPMLMQIMAHEYSHYYINKDVDNEMEADKNGIHIYLKSGFPIIESYEAWLETFTHNPSEENYHRYKQIDGILNSYKH